MHKSSKENRLQNVWFNTKTFVWQVSHVSGITQKESYGKTARRQWDVESKKWKVLNLVGRASFSFGSPALILTFAPLHCSKDPVLHGREPYKSTTTCWTVFVQQNTSRWRFNSFFPKMVLVSPLLHIAKMAANTGTGGGGGITVQKNVQYSCETKNVEYDYNTEAKQKQLFFQTLWLWHVMSWRWLLLLHFGYKIHWENPFNLAGNSRKSN